MTATGQLRTPLRIEEYAETRTSDGGVADAWSVTRTVWARLQGLRGRELFSAQQINPQTSHKVTIRYCKGLTSNARLVDIASSRIFNIESVVDIEDRHQFMQLLCTEVAG